KEAFAKARQRAKESKTRLGRLWEEAALYEWASLCYREVRAQYPSGTSLDAALKEAEQRCNELAELSPTKPAVLQIYLVQMAVYLGRAKADDVEEVFQRGLASDRSGEEAFRISLLVERANYYLKLKPRPKSDKAYDDALSALVLARKTTVPPRTLA